MKTIAQRSRLAANQKSVKLNDFQALFQVNEQSARVCEGMRALACQTWRYGLEVSNPASPWLRRKILLFDLLKETKVYHLFQNQIMINLS